MNVENREFALVGHDCPLGSYPSVVVPVGILGKRLVVSYFSPQGPELVSVPEESIYVKHSTRTTLGLLQFDHKRHGLFAFGEQSVVTYNLGQEGEFFASLLSSNEA